MRALFVVVGDPFIQVGLQLFDAAIDLTPERDLVELLQNRFVEALADAVGLRMPDLGLRVLDVVQRQIELIIMRLLLGANRVCTAARHQQRTLDAVEFAAFRTVYDALVREGEAIHPETTQQPGQRGRGKQSVAANLLRRFRLHADAVLRFFSNSAVPFTNHVGERAVRMPKVKQKISGSFRTLADAEHFCVIRSCLDTLRKQGHGMLTVLQRAFVGNTIEPTA